MNITFLGTGAGRPSKSRNTSSCFIEFNGLCVLLDAGEATQHQLLQTDIRPNRIDCICITHNHGDHIYGIPGLLNTISIEGRTEPVTIVCNDALKEVIWSILKVTNSYLQYEINFVTVSDSLCLPLSDEITVDTYPMAHDGTECYGYRFNLYKTNLNMQKLAEFGIKPGPLLGQLKKEGSVEFNGETIDLAMVSDETTARYIFCGDNEINQLNRSGFIQFCKDATLFVHEATLLEKSANHIAGHSFLGDVIEFADAAAVQHLLLNHISSRYTLQEATTILEQYVSTEKKGNVDIAEDFKTYVIQ